MKPGINAITDHSAQAPYYKFRTPYHKKYFEGMVQELDLSGDSVLLDLCCGSGEMAKGLESSVAKIYAIDGSAEMLSHSPKFDNVIYSQCDVNNEDCDLPEPVDHFVVGRAIHWIEPDALQRLADKHLKKNGKIAICSTQWFADGPWGLAYKGVLQKYDLFNTSGDIDFSGQETLSSAGFKPVRKLEFNSRLRCDLAYLWGYSLASAYGKNFRFLMENSSIFQNSLLKSVSPHLVNGALEMKIANWAIFYERT